MKTTEYLMVRTLNKYRSDPRCRFVASDNGSEEITVRILKDTVPLGSFMLLPYSNGDVYFYDFELFPEYCGHGEGTAVFPQILNYLHLQGYKNIRLQVSSSNPAALALYKHYGFTVLESVTF